MDMLIWDSWGIQVRKCRYPELHTCGWCTRRELWQKTEIRPRLRQWWCSEKAGWGGSHTQDITVGKKTGWNPKWMVPPKSGGVRFGIMRVVKSIKNRIKDKKVRDGSISHGNSEAIGRFQSGDEHMRSALKLTEAWTGREQTPRGKRKDTAV